MTDALWMFEDPVEALTRLDEQLTEVQLLLAALHPGIDVDDSCLDDGDMLTWTAFHMLPALDDLAEHVARYLHAARQGDTQMLISE